MLRCGSCDARILICAVCGNHDGRPALSATCQHCFEVGCEDAMVPREARHRVQHGDFRVRLVDDGDQPDRPVRVFNHLRRSDDDPIEELLKGTA